VRGFFCSGGGEVRGVDGVEMWGDECCTVMMGSLTLEADAVATGLMRFFEGIVKAQRKDAERRVRKVKNDDDQQLQ